MVPNIWTVILKIFKLLPQISPTPKTSKYQFSYKSKSSMSKMQYYKIR